MTRNMPWLNETMPELFIEISEELAIELNIKNGETVLVESKRLPEKRGAEIHQGQGLCDQAA